MGLINTLWCLQFPFQFLYSASYFLSNTGAASFKSYLKWHFQQVPVPRVLEHFRTPGLLPTACNPVGFLQHFNETCVSWHFYDSIHENWGQWLLPPFILEAAVLSRRTVEMISLERWMRPGTPYQGVAKKRALAQCTLYSERSELH